MRYRRYHFPGNRPERGENSDKTSSLYDEQAKFGMDGRLENRGTGMKTGKKMMATITSDRQIREGASFVPSYVYDAMKRFVNVLV